MKAVILAGGEGTRLRPLTCNIPKPMVPILNRPFMEHMLGHLRGHGVDSAVLTVCYLPDIIEAHFGRGESIGMGLSYVLEEMPLGTAGAVKNVEKELNQTFFVLNGDIFTDLDLGAMVRFHREEKAQVTLFLTPVEDPSAFGVVETDSTGRVLRFLEKPAPGETTSNWINGGIYIMEPQVLAHAPSGEPYSFERGLFPKLLEMGIPVYGYQARPYWMDLGTPASYLRVHHDLLTTTSTDHWTEASSASHEHSSIHPSARVLGPVLLGKGCSIGPGALVQGPSVLGAGCVVGKEATIQGSILWQNVMVESGAALEGCIVGDGARIGEGARVGERCILGDNVVLGKGNRMERGMVMWPGKSMEPEAVSFH
ncbi:MAG: NDP-sugar synthase [Chloroflexi bacterium]|nr:NDP-sugar synthase [Chloroflexota bacterium]